MWGERAHVAQGDRPDVLRVLGPHHDRTVTDRGTDRQERPEKEEMRGDKHRGVYLDLFQVFVTQVLEGINKILFDFNIQRVLHFSQPLHGFTSIEKRVAFEGEKGGAGGRGLNRAQLCGSHMQSHSSRTPRPHPTPPRFDLGQISEPSAEQAGPGVTAARQY